ncbi:MAG: PQQ-binding-like beta-propeller repeat protein [Planctomycetes bacterium]|nr:PQQ-binding-like beta-propeller repeat protein [Planctomycetota bacterium]
MRVTTSTTCLLAFLVLLGAAGTLSAQFYGPEVTDYFVSKTQVAGSRLAEQEIERARKDVAAGEYERALRGIQEVIDDHGSKALSSEGARFVGIRDFCNRFIAELPPEGREAYRRIFDPYARELYERGLEEQDPALLKEVYVRYQETSWGKKALLAALSLRLEQGELHEVVWLALLHREIHGDDADGAAVLAHLIIAARLLEDLDRLESLATDLTPELLARRVEAAGETTTLGALLDGQIADLRRRQGDRELRPSPRAALFKESRWVEDYDMQAGANDLAGRLDDFGEDAPALEIPWNPVQPVMDASSIYVTNGVSVSCFELFSKALRWSTAAIGNRPATSWVNAAQARANRCLTYPLVVDKGIVFTALETPLEPERHIWTFTPQLQIPHRKLIALDAATGRTLWQHYGFRGHDAEETEFVTEINVNSNPLIIGDKLFVAASRFHTSYHQYLCCFDRRDGHLLWSTFICTGQMEQNMFGNRVREAISGELVEKDGVIYHSTNIGVVAAIDARLGTLRFTVSYEQIPIPRQTRFDTRVTERAPAWTNQPPIVTGDKVYFAPMDCNDVVAVDRRSGSRIPCDLKRDRRNRFRYLVGPWKDWIIAAGVGIAFHNTRTGETIQPSYLFTNNRRESDLRAGIVGRPMIMNGRLIAPVRTRGVDKFMIWNIEEHSILDELPLPASRKAENLGNMVEGDGVVIVAATTRAGGSTQLRAYFDRDRVRRSLEIETASRPGDPEPIYRLGEFAIQGDQKDYAAARDAFEQALERARRGGLAGEAWADRARDALYRLYMEAAESRVALEALGLDAEKAYEQALAVSDQATRKVEILFLLLRRAYDLRDGRAFARHFQRILDDHVSTPYDYEELFRDQLPELRRDRYDSAAMVATVVAARFADRRDRGREAVAHFQELIARWPRAQIGGKTGWQYGYDGIAELVAREGAGVYAEQEEAALQLYRSGLEGGGFRLLQRVLDDYPNASVVTLAYRAISRAQLAAGDVDGAIRGIQEFLARFGQVTGEPLALLAQALEQRGLEDSARQIWTRLLELGPHELDDEAFLVKARERLEALPAPATAEPASFGLHARLSWSIGNADAPGEWNLIEPRGRRPTAVAEVVLVQRSRELIALALADGRQLWRMDALDTIDSADCFWWDGRLIARIDEAVVVLDPLTGREHWRYQPEALRITGFRVAQGKVFLVLERSGFPTDFTIHTRSLVDGSFVAEKVFKGVARANGLQLGRRFLLLPLENRLAALVIDGFSMEPAPAWPEGLEISDVMEPFFAPDDHVVWVTQGSRRGDQEIVASDPLTGRSKWRRRVGEGPARFFLDQTPAVLSYRLRPPQEVETVIVLDCLKGTALLKQNLGRGTDLVEPPEISGGDLVAVLKGFTNHVSVFAECFALSTSSTRWRSMSFTGRTFLAARPYAEGLLLRVREDVRGMREGRWQTKLFLLDRSTGRVVEEIELETRNSDRAGEVVFLGGRLVVADGPLLKVYEP